MQSFQKDSKSFLKITLANRISTRFSVFLRIFSDGFYFLISSASSQLDKFVLNNMQSDNTYMKEYLSYDILSFIGVTSPLYSYAHITVNGEEWGLYLAV